MRQVRGTVFPVLLFVFSLLPSTCLADDTPPPSSDSTSVILSAADFSGAIAPLSEDLNGSVSVSLNGWSTASIGPLPTFQPGSTRQASVTEQPDGSFLLTAATVAQNSQEAADGNMFGSLTVTSGAINIAIPYSYTADNASGGYTSSYVSISFPGLPGVENAVNIVPPVLTSTSGTGELVLNASVPNGDYEFNLFFSSFALSTPEPSTLIFAVSGLLVLAGARKRRSLLAEQKKQ